MLRSFYGLLKKDSHLFKYILALSISLTVFTFTACSPGYVIRAAYEQCKIILSREDIEEALQDPSVSPENKEKLRFVLDARAYAQSIGLEPKESFTKYASIDRDVLSWVVMGCKKDSFSPYTWWFPVVGSVPYKGYFEKEDALEQAKELEEKKYETWVRGTDAFSTLGWFNDPILSTTLQRSIPSIVDTVIHETTHTTFWFKDKVEFNESLANFIGMSGAVEFFKDKKEEFKHEANISKSRSLELTLILDKLYQDLDGLYKSEKTSEEKIRERDTVFEKAIAPLRARYPGMKSFTSLNNAEIMQRRIYFSHLDLFERLYVHNGNSLPTFIRSIQSIHTRYNEDTAQDPFKMVEEEVVKGNQ